MDEKRYNEVKIESSTIGDTKSAVEEIRIVFPIDYPEEKEIIDILIDVINLRKRKGVDYGDSWSQLGYKGEFPYIYGKVERLRKILWENNMAANESAYDSSKDLINHLLHQIILMNRESKKEK